MIKEYSWKMQGLYKEDANKIGKELETLGDELTAENVVDLARNENTSLHNLFDWDDSVAGEKWRKEQARHILVNIQVNIIKDNNTPKKTRAFVTTKRFSNYKPIETVINDTDQYKLLLEKAYRELNVFKHKYENLYEIQELLKDIPEIY